MSDFNTPPVGSDPSLVPPAAPVQAYPGAAPVYPGAPAPTYSTPAQAYPVAQSYPAAQTYPVAQSHPGAAGYPGAPQQPYGAVVAQQPYTAYGAPAYSGYAPVRPTSGLAVTSLVCGIAGILFSWLLVPLLASIVAIITGHMAFGQFKRNPGMSGKGMAITGLVLGYIAAGILALTVVLMVLSFFMVGIFTIPFIVS